MRFLKLSAPHIAGLLTGFVAAFAFTVVACHKPQIAKAVNPAIVPGTLVPLAFSSGGSLASGTVTSAVIQANTFPVSAVVTCAGGSSEGSANSQIVVLASNDTVNWAPVGQDAGCVTANGVGASVAVSVSPFPYAYAEIMVTSISAATDGGTVVGTGLATQH